MNLKEAQSFTKKYLWVDAKSANGTVIKNSKQAIANYYIGKGASADMGEKSTNELLSYNKFQVKHQKNITE